jgi:hypothetical protein
MLAVLECRAVGVGEKQVRLVYQASRIQRSLVECVLQPLVRERTKLCVQHWENLV